MSSVEALVLPVSRLRRRVSSRLLRSELRLLFGRRRNQVLLVVLALVPVLIGVAIRASTGEAEPGEGPPFLDRVTVMRAGRVVAAGTLDDLALLSRPTVFVETPEPSAAAAVLRRLGAASAVLDPDGRVVRADLPDVAVEDVTRALVHADVPVRGIGRSGRSLEELFVELTGEGFDVVG